MIPYNQIPGVIIHHLGPITMERIGHPDDTSLPKIKNLTIGDVVAVHFGEIDCRCHVSNRSKSLKKTTDEFLLYLAERYITKLVSYRKTLPDGVILCVISIVPPIYKKASGRTQLPINDTDEERSSNVKKLNEQLRLLCSQKDLTYLDVYSLYADKNGMLPPGQSDGPQSVVSKHLKGVHIGDCAPLKKHLKDLGWV